MNLRGARESRGFTQEEVARALGVEVATYDSWEREEVDIMLDEAFALAEFLNCSLDEIAGRTMKGGKDTTGQD